MIIDELSNLPLPVQSTDELPIERGELAYKVTYNNLVGSEIAGVKSNITTLQGNVTTLQNADSKIESSIAIIVNGDTASMAVPVGGYAYIKGNTHGLADGLYKNTSSSDFPVSGGTANSTVFTAVPTGAINDAFASRFALVETTIVSGTKLVPYPDGFNQDNCTIISSWLYAYSTKYYNEDTLQVTLQPSAIVFTKTLSLSEESPVAVVLMKI